VDGAAPVAGAGELPLGAGVVDAPGAGGMDPEAVVAVVELADDPLEWCIRVRSRNPTMTASTPRTAICATGLSLSAFLTSGPSRDPP
jgi:hypothetical protein